MSAPWFADLPPSAEKPLPDWAKAVTGWEGAEAAVAYRSRADGMLAALVGLTNPGGHIVIGAGRSSGVIDALDNAGRAVSVVPATDPDAIMAEVGAVTQVLCLPSVAEREMRFVPVNDIGAFAHGENLVLVVDNSILTPALFRPLDCGAHVVIEDWTGHGADVCTVAGSRRLLDLLPPGETDVTLPADMLDRVRERTAAAGTVADALSAHHLVTRVDRPGFAEHPWARETHEGFGPVFVLTCATDPVRVATALAGSEVTAVALDSAALRVAIGTADAARVTAAITTALDTA